MKKRWVVLLVLAACLGFSVARGEELLLDAAEGAHLAARLGTLVYAEEDTLLLRGRFFAEEATFPHRAHVVLDEGAVVYGVLCFPQGGTVRGAPRDKNVHIYGGIRADDTLTVSSLRIAGFVHLGDEGDDTARHDVHLRLEERVYIVTAGDLSSLFAMGDLVIAPGAHVEIESTEREDGAVEAENLWLQEHAYLAVRSAAYHTGTGAGIRVTNHIDVGENACLRASTEHEARALYGKSITLGKAASVYAEATGCYGQGITTMVLKTGPLSRIWAYAPQNGIGIYPFTYDADEWVMEAVQAHLFIDPTSRINATSFLFHGDFVFSKALTFLYTTPKPPALRKIDSDRSVVGYQAYYTPVKDAAAGYEEEDMQTAPDLGCYGMPVNLGEEDEED